MFFNFSGVDRFKRRFAQLEEHHGKGERSSPLQRQHASLPRCLTDTRSCNSFVFLSHSQNVLLSFGLLNHIDLEFKAKDLILLIMMLGIHFSRERVCAYKDSDIEEQTVALVARASLESPPRSQKSEDSEHDEAIENGRYMSNYNTRGLLKSASISASKCVTVNQRKQMEVSCVDKKRKFPLTCISESFLD